MVQTTKSNCGMDGRVLSCWQSGHYDRRPPERSFQFVYRNILRVARPGLRICLDESAQLQTHAGVTISS